MDYIAGSFYDGFVLYAMALEETLAEGGAQNDGINITRKTQNRRIWGEPISVVMYFNLREELYTVKFIFKKKYVDCGTVIWCGVVVFVVSNSF